jgi:hypothetical protein
MSRNRFYQDDQTTALNLYAIPEGTYAETSWLLPQGIGAMSSPRFAQASVSATAAGAMGITATGSGTMAFTFADAVGQLISSGTGSASFAIVCNTPLMTASLNAVGGATFTLLGSAALSGLGFAQASAAFSLQPVANSYAVGSMSGTTVDTGVLTVDAIKAGVWSAVAGEYNVSGTMGARLNTLATGGVDYGDMALAIRSELLVELARIDAAISSRSTIADVAAFAS